MAKKDPIGWYKFEIKEVITHYYFDQAGNEDTKSEILKRAEDTYAQIEKRGDRCFTLLWFDMAREGLKRMAFGARESEMRNLSQVIEEHLQRWDSDPGFRQATVLAEHL